MMKKADRVKYSHPEYSDGEIEGLMKYFRFETYVDLLDYMRKNERRE